MTLLWLYLIFVLAIADWEGFKAYFAQVFIACDQLLNALFPSYLWGHLSYADETLSARCWRAYRDGLWMGRIFMPPIDFVFGLWQGPDHCRNAYLKERGRRTLPPEYRLPS